MSAKNKILIYDEDCPLCSAYSSAFVRAGMLTANGRKNFNNICPGVFTLVDKNKCNNEIPLIDTQTKQVWYGIDALLEMLNEKIPFAKKIGNKPPVKWLLLKLYKLISYNRKVIVAMPAKAGYDSNPDFNMPYRLYFLVVFLIFNSLMLQPIYQIVLSESILSNSSRIQFQLAHLVLVSLNISTAVLLGKKQGLEYLGQINMLALTTILLITPLLLMIHFTGLLSRDLNHFYLGMVSILVMLDYARRMKYVLIIQKFPGIVFLNIVSVAIFLIYLVY